MDERVSDLLSYVFGFFVFYFLIQFLILQVYNDLVGEAHFHIVGVTNVMSNGVVRNSPIPWVHDFSIVVTFGGPPFDILIGVPSSSCSVTIGSSYYEKIVSQVPSATGVGSMDRKKNVVQVADFGIGGSGKLNL